MSSTNGAVSRGGRPAATSTAVPEIQLVSVEHPCIVKNFENGFRSLGGEQQLKHILENGDDHEDRPRKAQKKGQARSVVGVSLRPRDPLAKKLDSTPVTTQNVLVKVTLPKWTGRKRKRGTNEPFRAAATAARHDISAPDLVRQLHDNAGKYRVEAVGKIETTHRFNNLPDLQIQNREVPVMRELRQHALTPDYDTLNKFHIDLTPGTAGITALPRPPFFISPDQEEDDPFQPLVPAQSSAKKVNQSNEVDAVGTPRPPVKPKTAKPKIQYTPSVDVPEHLKSVVGSLQSFLENRPIATTMVLNNCFPEISIHKIKEAVPWVGQKSRHGPWKDCVIKHGIDPTSDPKYRFYQMVAVRPHNNKAKEESGGTHVFDGRTKMKGRTFQFCDIVDPSLAPMIITSHSRTIDEGYGGPQRGWYHNGTIAKMKVLVADKVKRMQSFGSGLEERAYAAVAALPEKIEESTSCDIDGKEFGAEAKILGMMVRREALKLHREPTGRAAGEDSQGGEHENAAANDPQIDPSLMSEQGQGRVDGDVAESGPEVGAAPVAGGETGVA